MTEDLELKNEFVKGGVSRDPFLSSRQESAAAIHRTLATFLLINPLDQQKNTTLTNPYAAFMEVVSNANGIVASVDGTSTIIDPANILAAIRGVRRTVYAGSSVADLQTHAPWVTASIAHPLRFIKSRLAARREIREMDGLYMLERALPA